MAFDTNEDLDQARQWIQTADAVAVLTGAGISAESGVLTFRDAGGYWHNFRPEDLATPEAFERDPKLVWEWYNSRRELLAKTQLNAGHKALVELETRKARFTLITQIVDGLHELAGSKKILKLHGDIATSGKFDLPSAGLPGSIDVRRCLRSHRVACAELGHGQASSGLASLYPRECCLTLCERSNRPRFC